MALATTVKSGRLRVLLGNSANPIVYTAPCALTEKSWTLAKEVTESQVFDCDDPDAGAWVEGDILSRQIRINGGGLLATESLPTWLDAWHSDAPVPARLEIQTGTGAFTHYTGLIHVTNIELVGNRADGRAQIRIEAASHGAMVRGTTPAGGG